MKTLLNSLKNTFLKIIYMSGHFRPIPAIIQIGKITKIKKNRKNRNFSKIDILLYSGRKYDIWPEISPLDPGKPPESLY